MKRITFIGSGNVATNLAKAFFSKGYKIVQICSATMSNAKALASMVDAETTNDLSKLKPADVFIMAVRDDVITDLADKLSIDNALLLHTAGSVNMDVLHGFKNHGVLYPLQTFTKEREVNFSSIAFFIEANTQENLEQLRVLASSLTSRVIPLKTEERLKLHVAAVFACNFLNYLLSIAADLSKENFSTLHSLVNEMVSKAFEAQHPSRVQTGPAVRNDRATLKKHEELLSLYPNIQQLYLILSQAITNQQHG